jgi:small subunit ribosomal protein S2
VVDPKRERIAVNEAKKLEIPVAALIDTNCNPDGIDYPIPGNDDALRSIKLITSLVAEAILKGQKRAAKLQPTKKEKEPAEAKATAKGKSGSSESEDKAAGAAEKGAEKVSSSKKKTSAARTTKPEGIADE